MPQEPTYSRIKLLSVVKKDNYKYSSVTSGSGFDS